MELAALSRSEMRNTVRVQGATMRLETLAYLVRQSYGQGQDGVELLEAAAHHMLQRVRPISRSVRHVAISTDEDWQDGTQFAFFAMLREFERTPSDQLTFWEVNFPHIFKKRVIDGILAQRRKVDRDAVSVEILAEDGVDFRASLPDPIDQLTIRQILSVLSPKEAIAARLCWFDQLPISGEGSIAELMRVSRKTVHKHLNRAKAKVQKDPRFAAWTGRA